MRNIYVFEEYDLIKLKNALRLLKEVYDYYYGYPQTKRQESRLLTIIIKLQYLIDANEYSDRIQTRR